MTALTELQDGQPGEAFVGLVGRTVRAVAISRNFPPPEGQDRWGSEAVAAMTAAFFASPQTPRRLADLRVRCTSEDGLRHRLQTTVRNFLADVGRQTDVGRLVLRINEVLGSHASFERVGEHWALVSAIDEPAAVDLEDLVAAATTVKVDVPAAWLKSSGRKSPEIDQPSVVRLARAVLSRAGGPVRPAVLAQVTARRLGIGQTPLSVDATAFDPPQGAGTSPDATADGVVVQIRANEVFGLLNDPERAAIGLADLSVAALGEVLRVSKSSAAIVRSRAVAVLGAELSDEENGQEVADAVLDLAREWVSSWTTAPDATY